MKADDVFGNIEFSTNLKAKSIRVRILVDGLKVTLPYGISKQSAIDFIQDSADKILKKQEKLKAHTQSNPYFLEENTAISTLTFEIIFTKVSRTDIFFQLKNNQLKIEFPLNSDHKSVVSQKNCWNGIKYFLQKEAKRLLPERTRQLAMNNGFIYSSVKIQSSKTRWGSCSRYKSINLSYYLMLLPAHLIDYVILHELCHTRQMNHSEKFWKEMDTVTQNKSKALRKELKKYQIPNF